MIVESTKPALDELAHYGVKGMKWGVRREETRSTLTRAERKDARKKTKAFRDHVFEREIALNGGNYFQQRVISDAEYKSLGTKKHVVRKGRTVGRITQRKGEKLRDLTYVSYTNRDRNVYRAVMPMLGSIKSGGNRRYKTSYEATYKTLETLKSPSEKERVDAFVELFDTPSIKMKNGKTLTGREYMARLGYRKETKTLNSQQLGQKFYYDFVSSQYMNMPINTAYFTRLRDKGYNSIVDDNDRGRLSDVPLIILNPNGTLKQMSVKKLSADDINNAQRQLVPDEEDKK